MNEQEKRRLETHVKQIFSYNRMPPSLGSRARIRAIVSRSLHELALRDLLMMSGAMLSAAFILLAGILRVLSGGR